MDNRLILFALIAVAGCAVTVEEHASENHPYSALLTDYDNSLCGGTGYGYKIGGFNSGIRLLLKDAWTKQEIQGYGYASTRTSGGSLDSQYYACEEGIDDDMVLISAYAKGHAPEVFIYRYPKNKLATIEIWMNESCHGHGLFDDLRISSQIWKNQTLTNEYVKDSEQRVIEIVKQNFKLDETDYLLQCLEGDLGRGGYIKANGTFKDGSPFELFYHWGWCSSGGADCGETLCFNSSSEDLVKLVNVSIGNCLKQ